jgi:hypothetical protein
MKRWRSKKCSLHFYIFDFGPERWGFGASLCGPPSAFPAFLAVVGRDRHDPLPIERIETPKTRHIGWNWSREHPLPPRASPWRALQERQPRLRRASGSARGDRPTMTAMSPRR